MAKNERNKILRQQHRDLERSKRDLERELLGIDRDEKNSVTEAKKAAKRNDNALAKIHVKQVIRLRKQRERIMKSKGVLTGVQQQTVAAKSTLALTEAMTKAASVMTGVNQMVSPEETMRMMTEFNRQQEMAGMKEEMIDDILDDELSEEADELVEGVFESIGLELTAQMPSTVGAAKLPSSTTSEAVNEDQEIEAMLSKLMV